MEELQLKNGIVMRVENNTAPLSGDLHLIRLVFTYTVPLDESDTELRAAFGESISSSRLLERPAVHERDLEQTTQSLMNSYLNTVIPYMEHPRFIPNFKMKNLIAVRDRAKINANMRAAGLDPDGFPDKEAW